MYAAVHLVADRGDWEPNRGQVEMLLGELGARGADHLIGFNAPLLWDSLELPVPSFRRRALSLSQMVTLIAERPALVLSVALGITEWADALDDELKAVPNEISDGYVPWDVGMTIGPFSIADVNGHRTATSARFEITIGADWVPSAQDEYIRRVGQLPEMQKVRASIGRACGSRCGIYMTIE